MNYYEHHIGDYQRKTAHLTLAEHGAYTLMLQTFYATERPLPADRKVLYRLLRADSVAERKAVDSVTAQFWERTDAGLTNNRAGEVLDNYKRWVDQQKANGKRGGRPPKTDGLSETKPNGVPNGGDHARVPLPTSHPPLPNTQNKSTHSERVPQSVKAAEEAGSVCGTFKKIGSDPHAGR
jgi:uncharacterized protein YdaU (DUF1376 family)